MSEPMEFSIEDYLHTDLLFDKTSEEDIPDATGSSAAPEAAIGVVQPEVQASVDLAKRAG